MKQFLLTLFTTCFLCTVLIAQSPIAYYPFNGNANDAAGTINGTVNGASLTTNRFREPNTAYNFNGTGNHINLGNSTTLRPTAALTVSAWFILENTAGSISGRQIISCTEASGYNLGYDKASNRLVFQVLRNGAYGSPSATATQYENNGWHHIAGTFDGRYTRLYIDGELKATDDAGAVYPIGYSYPFGNVNTYIGGEAAAGFNIDPNYYWQGKIDEVKIYNTALSSTQIKTESGFLPGSGKTINFTGSHYLYATAVNGVNDFATNQDFTVEFWLKAPVTQTNTSTLTNSIISNVQPGRINYDIYFYNQAYAPHGAVTGTIGIQRWDGSNNPYTISTIPINDNKWHHCAFIRSGGTSGTISLYIDGILQNTQADNTSNSLTNYLMQAGGVGNFGYGNFNGNMDELRIWNVGLTAAQLRERMCRKPTPDDALWNNLTVYYRFDENDVIGSGSTGTIVNDSKNAESLNASYQILTVPHVTSGAPIGNTSAFNYSATPSATLIHPEGESLQATVTAGSPSGIHVYSVTEAPNTVSGALGTGNNNRYFGVFVVGGTSPQYTATYDYTGNPNVTALNETSLLLYKRTDNTATWVNSNATLNTAANTLTATGENTEYLLGGGFSTLPVSLLDFTVTKQNTVTLLQWRTESEQNNKGFEVQHSKDGISFTTIGFVKGAGNSSSINSYSFKHTQPVKGRNYYRLKQIDEDDRSVLSRIQLLRFDEKAALTFYPNPVADVLNIQIPDDAVTVTLYDAMGKKLWQQQKPATTVIAIPAKQFSPGLLLLEVISSSGERFIQKVLKH